MPMDQENEEQTLMYPDRLRDSLRRSEFMRELYMLTNLGKCPRSVVE